MPRFESRRLLPLHHASPRHAIDPVTSPGRGRHRGAARSAKAGSRLARLSEALQKNPVPEMACGGAAGCAVTATWRCCPEESAQTNAIIHPIKVQPASRFKAKIAVKSDLLRARKAGRK